MGGRSSLRPIGAWAAWLPSCSTSGVLNPSAAPQLQDGVPRCFAAVYDGHNGVLAAEHAADRLHHLLAAEPALRTCTGKRGQAGACLCQSYTRGVYD